jgi:tetratricopeptide (TPR) repeat protein
VLDGLWEQALNLESQSFDTFFNKDLEILISWLKEILADLQPLKLNEQERFLHQRLESRLGETGDFKAQEAELLLLAQSFQATADYEQARNIWEKIIELSSHRNYEGAERAYEALISLYLKEQNLEQALSIFTLALTLVKDKLMLQSLTAKLLFEQGYYQEAEKLYQDILTQNPEDSHANMCLAIISAYRGELKTAVKYARLLWGKAKVGQVIAAYQKRIEDLYRRGEYHLHLGKFYEELGFKDDALLEYQKALADPKTSLAAHNCMALIFKSEALPELAVRQLLRGLETSGFLEEEYLELRYNLAQIYEEEGRLREALSALQECYAIDIRYKEVEERIKMITEKLEMAV